LFQDALGSGIPQIDDAGGPGEPHIPQQEGQRYPESHARGPQGHAKHGRRRPAGLESYPRLRAALRSSVRITLTSGRRRNPGGSRGERATAAQGCRNTRKYWSGRKSNRRTRWNPAA
jgi:hypothetical protein